MFRPAILLTIGVYACSTAVLWIKSCDVDPVVLAAYRQLLAAALLAPVFVLELRRHSGRFARRGLLAAVLPGAVLGVHFIAWNIGARATTAANATLIVNIVPVAMPFMLYVATRERVRSREGLGTVIAMVGVLALGAADFHISREYLIGDAVCFVAMLLVACYLALGRRNRGFPSVWLYVVPVYFVGGMVCLATATIFRRPLGVATVNDAIMIAGLAVAPTIVGHSCMNYALRYVRGQVVGIANLGQFVFAGVMAYFLLDEAPQVLFYPAAVFVLFGALIAIRSKPAQKMPAEILPQEGE